MKQFLIITIFALTACWNDKEHKKHNNQGYHEKSASIKERTSISSDTGQFQLIKDDLYISANGHLAFKTVDHTDPQKPQDDFLTTIHTDNLDYDKEASLNEIIDTATFSTIGDLYYRDKNHVYYHFPMLDGGTFFIVWEADPKTLNVLGDSYYAKDKKNVFHRGRVLGGADSKTFQVVSQPNKEVYEWYAKDKKHAYAGSEFRK